MDNAEQPGPADQEVARLRELLRNAIRLSGVTNRKIERHLGMSQGSLSRLLAGGIELKVKHILEIVEILGLPPGQFFRIAYPEEAQPTSALQAFHKALSPRTAGKDEEEAP
ncbi:MAG TPA: helix-turn-helix transcriptional regulator, partial [Thermoanaerobaculia bacterium]